jgi:cation transport regulator ChaC
VEKSHFDWTSFRGAGQNGCAASDLIQVAGRRAWGVLYEIPEGFVFDGRTDQLKTLAQIEGSRYEPREITVVNTKGEQMKAWTFLVKDEERRTGLATSAAYVSWIVYGLRQNGIPEEYISHVIEIAKETSQHADQIGTEQNRLIDRI